MKLPKLQPPKAKHGILAKSHSRNFHGMNRTIVALCDSELLGRIFKEGEVTLDLQSYKDFYDGSRVSQEEAVMLLKNAENANVVGEKSVEAAREAFGFAKERIKTVKGVPHLQIYKV